LHFIDNWRSALIILVVLHHIALVYGAGAPFYYVEPPWTDPRAFTVFLAFILINQAFFMGALFLMSGYFTPGSFERKGPGSFLKDRVLRLGIPLAVFIFVLSPIASIGYWQMPASLTGITSPLTWQKYPKLIGVGPLWFVAMLLIFDFGYAAWRMLTKNRASQQTINSAPPGYLAIGIFILALTVASYLIRIVVPIGKFVLDVFPTIAYLPQYLSFFVLGIIASRRNWFRTIANRTGGIGLIMALVVTVLLFPIALSGLPLRLTGTGSDFVGNGHSQSAIYALWDSIFAVGMCLGLITIFRRFLDRPGRLSRFLSQQSFTVYIIHAPVIVLLAVSLKGIQLQPLLKFGLAAAIGVPLCFVVAHIVRRIPLVSRIL
jgi:surface polysaccharide O-acyltransferase-like enzyme